MSGRGLGWGTFAPQGWKGEFRGWESDHAWARARELAQRAEGLGYDHLWVYDHVESAPRREPVPVFEAWTLLTALAAAAPRIRLGQLVTCAAYRNPGLLAKQAACLDVISGGRLIFGLGAGWYAEEYAAYGWRFPPVRERLAVLEETLLAVRQLWDEERTTFHGRHVELEDALCDPKPLQARVPIWVGGGGEKVTLRIAAEHADATNWQVGLDDFVRKSQVLREHCDRVGRDFDSIVRTHAPDCILFDSERDLARWLNRPDGGDLWAHDPDDVYVRENFVGTVDQVVEKVQAFVDAGAREFVLWFRDYPSDESLTRFAREVIPRIQVRG